MISAFDLIRPCSCGTYPSLWNLLRTVYFSCERADCLRRGPGVPQQDGAAVQAALEWNRSLQQ